MDEYLGVWTYRARLAVIVTFISLFTVGLPPAALCWYILEYPLGALFGDVLWTVVVPVFCIITPMCWGLAAAFHAPRIRASLRLPEVSELPFNRMILLALVMAVVISFIYLGALDAGSLDVLSASLILIVGAGVLG